jgi:glutathione synthase
MDPVSSVLVDADTTFALMHEAKARDHHVDHCLMEDVGLERGRVIATVRNATLRRDPLMPITLGEPERIDLAGVDAVLVRKDPPFGSEYLWLTLILEHLRGETLVLNDPLGLRNANEKLYACQFPELMPETLVDSDKKRIRSFVDEVGGTAVIKPVDGHGGEGIFRLTNEDKNANALIETVTRHGRRVAMIQRFVPEVELGDKRILLVDGQPIGAILRVPRNDDVRSNIHVGGTVVATDLDLDDRRIIETMGPRLVRDGLWFVGIDVIGGKLTEVNVTSPTGIQQMSSLSGENLEASVIDSLERKVLDSASVRRAVHA